MVNQFRTLLLNRSSDYFASIADAIYIPETFNPVKLSAQLSECHDIIFPPSADAFTEYRFCDIYTRLTHRPDLIKYVEALDKRFTYLATLGTNSSLVTPTVTISGTATESVPGYRVIAANRGRYPHLAGLYSWTIASVDANNVDIVVKGRPAVRQSITNGTPNSKGIPLISDYLYASFTLPSTTIVTPFKYTYDCIIPGMFDYETTTTALTRFMAAGGGHQLFVPVKDAGKAALLAELRKIYETTCESLIRTAVTVISYVYQLDNIRGTNE